MTGVVRLSLDVSTVGEDYLSPASLGTIARIASTQKKSDFATIRRFALQSLSRRLLQGERVSKCLRVPRPMMTSVDVLTRPDLHAARLRGLQVCGSVWLCPVCASTISEYRRRELSRLIAAAPEQGAQVYLQTLTYRHTRYDALSLAVSGFRDALRAFSAGRNGVEALRCSYGYLGHVTALEVTYSERNGWHVHAHQLVFLPSDADSVGYSNAARSRWLSSLRRLGLDGNDHAYQLDVTNGAVADYVSKWGHEPASQAWGVETEMTKSHMKVGRISASVTPFQLLALSETVGDAAAKFVEYARAFKGRHQLQYSRGLRALFGVQDVSDDAIAQGLDTEMWLLASISLDGWRVVVSNDAIPQLVNVAKSGDLSQLVAFLGELGVTISAPSI